ncbi:MAG: hypothetical protein VYA11_05145 [Planctomycetota bacterium]|nr:hypothetical protein [Planctomycetota bacterium]
MTGHGCIARLANRLHPLSAMPHFFQDLIDKRMPAEDLIQLACLLAVAPPTINRNLQRGLSSHLHDYWAASCDRLDRWTFHLPSLRHSASASPCPTLCDTKAEKKTSFKIPAHPSSILALITEMILSEPLARIWAAILSDTQKNLTDTNSAIPTGRFKNPACDILERHSKLMQRTMERLERCLPEKKSCVLVQDLFRRSRRWTDLLLAHMEQLQPVSRFAPNPQRCLDFAEDLRSKWTSGDGPQLAALKIASARQVICESATAGAFSSRLNYRIGASVLQSCDSDDLELLGLINPHGVIRLWETFARCETMLGGALEDRSMPITSPVA